MSLRHVAVPMWSKSSSKRHPHPLRRFPRRAVLCYQARARCTLRPHRRSCCQPAAVIWPCLPLCTPRPDQTTHLIECEWIILPEWSWLLVTSSLSSLLGYRFCVAFIRCLCFRLSVTLIARCVVVFMRSFRSQHISFDFEITAKVSHVHQHTV